MLYYAIDQLAIIFKKLKRKRKREKVTKKDIETYRQTQIKQNETEEERRLVIRAENANERDGVKGRERREQRRKISEHGHLNVM